MGKYTILDRLADLHYRLPRDRGIVASDPIAGQSERGNAEDASDEDSVTLCQTTSIKQTLFAQQTLCRILFYPDLSDSQEFAINKTCSST